MKPNRVFGKRIITMMIAILMALSLSVCLNVSIVKAEEDDDLTSTQRNSINMLNYMTVLTQEVNEAKGNQVVLEEKYSALFNNIYPNAVDSDTQGEISKLMDTINHYRMISVKRDRIQYIYDQNKASAFRQAIPNPIGLLSAVQSGNMLKAAVSVLYMTADSVNSYKTAASQADLEFLKDGWELDDEEMEEQHNSTRDSLTYMLEMVRKYDFPGDYALNKESVEDFVSWSGKPDSQLVNKTEWLKSHQDTYKKYGPYWLELAKDYFNSGDYEMCLKSIKQYEAVSTRIFRKDIDYATTLPVVIVSAKETMSKSNYVKLANRYCDVILSNTKDEDWSLRYFVAQIYMDLYAVTEDKGYIDKAYNIAFNNVNVLVDSQKELNKSYLAEYKKIKIGKDVSDREKKEIKQYNKQMKAERKIALPPVSEALYLNCELLFGLAKEKKIDSVEQKKIDSILHENGDELFLTKAIDDRFWFNNEEKALDVNKVEAPFDEKTITIPASCVSDRTSIVVIVNGKNGKTKIKDWTVTNVDRPKKAKNCSEYIAEYKSKDAKDCKYQEGDKVTVRVIPVKDSPKKYIDFNYNAVAGKKLIVLKDVEFERVTE